MSQPVRPHPSPREDSIGSVPPPGSARRGARRRTSDPTGDVRVAGVHPLLGTISERELGGEAPDGPPPTDAGVTLDSPLVSEESAPTAQGATGHKGAEAPGP